jgi:glycosyltransferase involved in cell wall biosynthesis
VKISIITPVFNGIEFLQACVENVVKQAVPDLEHIIVDGGSTDGTLEEIARLSCLYPHLRLVTGPDEGLSDAINKGIRAARGKIVGILPVDDFYEDGVIAAAVCILEPLASPTVVAANCKIINLSNGLVSWNRPSRLTVRDFLIGHQIPGNPTAYFYHKKVHDIVGYYDVNDHFAMDLDFLLSCARTVDMIYVNSHWGNFRLRPGSKTFEDSGNARRRVRAILERHSLGFSRLDRNYFMMSRILKKIMSRVARKFNSAFPGKQR